MSGLLEAAAAPPRHNAAARGSIDSDSPVASPTTVKSEGGRGRKRTLEGSGVNGSPESRDDVDDGSEEKRRLPGVKRACNECRQQKVCRYPISWRPEA